MSPFFRLLPLAVLLAALSSLRAAEAAPAASAPVSAGYHLKNKSTFTISETARPPFWPIGYTHQTRAEVKAAAPVVELKIDPDQYVITSILMGTPRQAVINQRLYREGESLRVKGQANPDAKIRVLKVLDGSVILEASGQQVTVPLRRPVLLQHKIDEPPDLNE